MSPRKRSPISSTRLPRPLRTDFSKTKALLFKSRAFFILDRFLRLVNNLTVDHGKCRLRAYGSQRVRRPNDNVAVLADLEAAHAVADADQSGGIDGDRLPCFLIRQACIGGETCVLDPSPATERIMSLAGMERMIKILRSSAKEDTISRHNVGREIKRRMSCHKRTADGMTMSKSDSMTNNSKKGEIK